MRILPIWRGSRGLFTSALILAASIGFAQAQQGKPGGGGGGGHTEAATNNLSYPAAHTVDSATARVWNVPEGVLGIDYSYGCDKEEMVGTSTYPNTSCVDESENFLTAEACTAEGAKCAGLSLDRMYWQKVTTNDWWAESIGPSGPQQTSYLDWGDSLEGVTWKTTSNIRVETTPFAAVTPSLVGYQMWHVFAQGPDEQWGVRTTDDGTLRPYVYSSPFAIIHTPAARLNIAKLEEGASTCPTTVPPGGSGFVMTWTGSSWAEAMQLRDIPYTAELNVGGKYVYGYNWMLRRDQIEPWNKAGWWRLTFYTSDASVLFDTPGIPLTPPPSAPSEPPPLAVAPQGMGALAEAETGTLYVPVIDAVNKLTYIDICVAAGASGSGGGGGGKGGGQ